ncbi:MAG: hypothetical protein JW959_11500 [Pirellulales bacterium]|nr:hypothetical protein [Pirellulales bacterium]
MPSGVTTVCFAASYAVALALEISRLLFRSSVRGLAMICFAAAGLFAQTVFLYSRAVEGPGAPLSSERDWYLMAAWAIVAIYLYLSLAHPKTPFGLFLLPLALGLIGAGTFLANAESVGRDSASLVWGTIHGGAIVLAAVAVLVGFVTGAMYLGKAWRLKRKRLPAGGLSLPSLEWLQWTNGRAIAVAVAMLGVGIFAGTVLNRINIADPQARLGWTDPVVISTCAMFCWLLAAMLIAARRPARQGRKVAYLTLAAFVFLVIVLVVGLAMDTKHWGRGTRDGGQEPQEKNMLSTIHYSPPAILLSPSSSLLSPFPGGPPC